MFKLWKRDRRSAAHIANGKTETSARRRPRLAVEPLEERTLLAAGALDPSFGDGGKVFTEFTGSQDNRAQAVVVQPDGKIVAGGFVQAGGGANRAALVRYNADGSLDATFGTGGRVSACDVNQPACEFAEVRDLLVQPDGKIIAVGVFGSRSVVARYSANGGLDPSFGNGGFAAAFGLAANAVALQADGRIVAAGSATPPSSSGTIFAAARYRSDGSFDPSFGTNGVVVTPIRPESAFPRDVARGLVIQPDGKIAVAGTDCSASSATSGCSGLAALVRYNPNGDLDTGFAEAGKLRALRLGQAGDSVSRAAATDVAIQSDGDLILVGRSTRTFAGCFPTQGSCQETRIAIAIITPPGHVASVVNHTAGIGIRDVSRVVVGNGDRIYVAALGSNPSPQNPFTGAVVSRLGPTGALEATSELSVSVDQDTTNSHFIGLPLLGLALQQDGRAILAGTRGGLANGDFSLFRFQAAGSMAGDNTFGNGGRVFTDFEGSRPSEARAAVPLPDGKILVAGNAGSDFGLVRYLANGSLDPTFGQGGRVTTDLGQTNDEVRAVLIQADGKILVGGNSSTNFAGNATLVRYHPNGTIDTSFGSGGKVVVPTGRSQVGFDGPFITINTALRGLLLQPDGKIVVVAASQGGINRVVLLRFNADGSSDLPFPAFTDASDEVLGQGLLPDSRFVTVGSKREQIAMARYYANGQKDTGLGPDGSVLLQAPFSSPGTATALLDGRWIVTGQLGSGGPAQLGLARYLPNGNLDPTFGNVGSIPVDLVRGPTGATGILVQPDGRLIVIGQATVRESPDTHFGLVRLDPNGSADPSFGIGGKTVTHVGGTAPSGGTLQPDGKILVLGGGPAPNGTRKDFVILRYLGDDRAADANLRFVDQVFLDILQRTPDPAGRTAFVGYLNQGGNRALVSQVITASTEYRTLTVRQLYGQILNRNADPGGLNAFAGFLGAGGTVDQVRTALYSSPEYFQSRSGNANTSFVAALFRDGLNRAIDPAGQQHFAQALANGVARAVVVNFVLQSPEAREGTVQTWYRRFLRRPADPGGLQAFVGALQAGMREEVALGAMIGSEEYLRRV